MSAVVRRWPLAAFFGLTFAFTWSLLPLARMDLATGALDTVALADFAPNPNLDRKDRWPVRNPFTASGHSTAWTGGFVRGRGHETELTWVDLAGNVTQRLRWLAPPRPVTEEELQGVEDRMRASQAMMAARNVPEQFRAPPGGLDAYIAAIKEAATEPLPVFMDLLTDPDGNVWIADYDYAGLALPWHPRSPRYRVVSPEGEWLGSVDPPPGVGVLAIGRDHVLGVELNELDVQAVSLYRIER